MAFLGICLLKTTFYLIKAVFLCSLHPHVSFSFGSSPSDSIQEIPTSCISIFFNFSFVLCLFALTAVVSFQLSGLVPAFPRSAPVDGKPPCDLRR